MATKTFEDVAKIEQEIRNSVKVDFLDEPPKDIKKDNDLLRLRSQLIIKVMDLGAYPDKTTFAEINALIHYSLAYFLATNEEIDYHAIDIITPQQLREIITIYKRMLEATQGRKEGEDMGDAILHFLENIAGDNREEVLERVKAYPTTDLLYPIDKPNNKLWDMARDSAKHGGQIALNVLTGDPVEGKEPLIELAIDFENLPIGVTISRELTAYDKRVYIAVGALWNGGNRIITISQIYRMMGYRKNPADTDSKKINDSLTKMGWARLYINNEQEAKLYKKYDRVVYDAPLLSFERTTAYINGQIVEGAIKLGFEPPMIKFARERNQVQPIPLQVLYAPVSKTERNLEIEDYLLDRISRMKSPKSHAQRKILFNTLCDRCKITGKTQRTRTRGNIVKFLDHYKSTGFIKDYVMDTDSITIDPGEKRTDI